MAEKEWKEVLIASASTDSKLTIVYRHETRKYELSNSQGQAIQLSWSEVRRLIRLFNKVSK